MRGNVVMTGYYNDPEATQTAFEGGWFHTGDAAVVHQDGYMEIRDRFKDIIISGGENISSIEVEGALLRHRSVLEVAVVGMPDEKLGRVAARVRGTAAGGRGRRRRIAGVRARRAGALQGAERVTFRGRAAEDRDRQDPEVCAARESLGHRAAMNARS